MLSDELRNLALWMRTRQKFRARRDLPCDAYGEELAIERLDELADRATAWKGYAVDERRRACRTRGIEGQGR